MYSCSMVSVGKEPSPLGNFSPPMSLDRFRSSRTHGTFTGGLMQAPEPARSKFPDPGDVYTFVASSGSAPSFTAPNNPPSGTAYSGFAGIGKDVFGASQYAVYFVLPDYTGPYHTSSQKCGGRNAASLSDYSAGGYILSADSNVQNEVLDTGRPGQFGFRQLRSVFG